MKGSLRWQEISKRDVNLLKCVSIDEVDATAPIHKHLLRGEATDLGFEYQCVVA
jgi:hypothetical protein